jgi:hypothetical protein
MVQARGFSADFPRFDPLSAGPGMPVLSRPSVETTNAAALAQPRNSRLDSRAMNRGAGSVTVGCSPAGNSSIAVATSCPSS